MKFRDKALEMIVRDVLKYLGDVTDRDIVSDIGSGVAADQQTAPANGTAVDRKGGRVLPFQASRAGRPRGN